MTRCPKLDRPTWSNDFPASIQKDAPPFPPSPPPGQITLRAVSLLQECKCHHRRGSDSCQLTGPAMQPIRKRQETDCGCIGPTGLSRGAGVRHDHYLRYITYTSGAVYPQIPSSVPFIGAMYRLRAAHCSTCSRDQARTGDENGMEMRGAERIGKAGRWRIFSLVSGVGNKGAWKFLTF